MNKAAPASELIASDLSIALTLPADFYIDPAIARSESDKIFCRTWQIVGRRDDEVGRAEQPCV